MKTTLGLLAVLLLGGCADSGNDVQPANGKSPADDAATAAQEPAARTAAVESGPVATAADSSLDAERLLASTLESAKAQNKRVLVHLGAPW